jgi:tRNA(Ile)-lysidine synthase
MGARGGPSPRELMMPLRIFPLIDSLQVFPPELPPPSTMLAVPLLSAKLIEHIRYAKLLRPGDRVGVACSGGADSVGLLRLLLELRGEIGVVLSVVHFNHRLRGEESDRDERFVAELAHRHDLEFFLQSADTAQYAKEKRLSLEAAARDLRYAFFAELASAPPADGKPNKIATAHTLDDQAETVLMRIIRGTGLRGLGGIHPRVLVQGHEEEEAGDELSAEVLRPLLPFRHRELEEYLRAIKQEWREDSSNRDLQFTRNRVRAQLLPLLEREFNPSVMEGLADLADIARGEEEYWQNEVAGWVGTGIHWTEPDWALPASGSAGSLVQLQPASPDPRKLELQKRLEESGPLVMDASVDLVWLLSEPRAIQRRIIKAIGDLAGFPLEFKHIQEVLAFAERDHATSKQLALPLGWKVERTPEALVFRTPDLRTEERIPVDYAYVLPIPGMLRIPEAGVVIEVAPTDLRRNEPGYNRDQLFDPALVSETVTVRNWRAGDRYWPAHTKAPKKVKELLQERGVTGAERKHWPVIESGGQVIWLRGFATPAAVQPGADAQRAFLIREAPLDEDDE